jgi:hypothetical protein
MAAEAAARDRDEKPYVPAKRAREWEEEDTGLGKKPASEENRAKMDDVHHHRPSPPPHTRRESLERVRDEYHGPSSHSLPPINSQLPPMSDGPRMQDREERKEIIEPAARKVDEDEDYDGDDVEDVKRGPNGPGAQVKENNSPNGNGANGVANGPGDN